MWWWLLIEFACGDLIKAYEVPLSRMTNVIINRDLVASSQIPNSATYLPHIYTHVYIAPIT